MLGLVSFLVPAFSGKEGKMYKKFFLLTVIVILYSGYAYADDQRDGNWWNNLDMGQKQMYIEAVSDGNSLASLVLFHYKNDNKKCQAVVEGSYKSFMDKYFTNITSAQVSNGLDLFYSNYENLNIGTEKAFLIVLKTIHNDPEDEIKDLIKAWRK
jgi:hypothetical protein